MHPDTKSKKSFVIVLVCRGRLKYAVVSVEVFMFRELMHAFHVQNLEVSEQDYRLLDFTCLRF